MINICASILLGSTVFLSGALLSSFKLIKEDYTKVIIKKVLQHIDFQKLRRVVAMVEPSSIR